MKKYSSTFLVILIIISVVFILNRVFIKKSPINEKSIPVISISVCDEILKKEEILPIVKFEGKSAKVNFSTLPAARMFFTAITLQAAENANFAGHYNFVSWGCGTDCAGYSIVDSINGKIVEYIPVNEDGNSYYYDVNSRLLVLNPKEDFEKYRGLTIGEIVNGELYTPQNRTYYELIEEKDGTAWLYKLCTENTLDGIYALPGKYVGYQVTYYAKLKTISSAREARFYWLDSGLKKILSPNDQYAWFWAMPTNFLDDTKLTEEWFKFMDDNKDAVYKITGIRRQDDCGYYGPEHCIQNIDIKKIEVVGTSKLISY